MSSNDEYEDVIYVEGNTCVSNAKVFGLYDSIRRAKFPMSTDINSLSKDITGGITNLALSDTGSGHDQWLTGVIVQLDLTFSNKAWVELERYHFFDFVSSQSTMHKITKFDLDKSYNKYVDKRVINVLKEKVSEYNDLVALNNSLGTSKPLADVEYTRVAASEKYLEILYNNPAGFLLTAGMTTNYRQLKTVYKQRKHHRLPDWQGFCEWIETLPYSELITGDRSAVVSEAKRS